MDIKERKRYTMFNLFSKYKAIEDEAIEKAILEACFNMDVHSARYFIKENNLIVVFNTSKALSGSLSSRKGFPIAMNSLINNLPIEYKDNIDVWDSDKLYAADIPERFLSKIKRVDAIAC